MPDFLWDFLDGALGLDRLSGDPIKRRLQLYNQNAFLLPLLLDFGLLEFVGALLTKFMRPLFRVPGRAAVDCITSWIGDGTLGVMLTCNQYEGGYYSAREASVISTTFSAVSITFSLVVLDHHPDMPISFWTKKKKMCMSSFTPEYQGKSSRFLSVRPTVKSSETLFLPFLRIVRSFSGLTEQQI